MGGVKSERRRRDFGGLEHSFLAVVNVEFLIEVFQMALHRLMRNEQPRSDLFVPQPPG
jgi:hypothetical protein